MDYTEHIAPLRAAAPASMRCVLVSATLPQHTFDELQDLFMGLGAAFGPGLHRTAQGERVCRSVAGKAAAQLVNSSCGGSLWQPVTCWTMLCAAREAHAVPSTRFNKAYVQPAVALWVATSPLSLWR